MRHLTYLAVLAGCLLAALWLEPLLRVGVLRQWRRLVMTLLPVVRRLRRLGRRSRSPPATGGTTRAQVTGITLPGALPLEELLFFLVVPVCAILGFEAVRKVTGWPVGRR